jgi:hypothetical protein
MLERGRRDLEEEEFPRNLRYTTRKFSMNLKL